MGAEGGLKRKRSGNFSLKEKGLLVDLVGRYSSIIECKRTDGSTMQQKEGAWLQLTDEFNALVDVARDCKALKVVRFSYQLTIVYT